MIDSEIREISRNLGSISYEDSTILITGGAGFLGSWICDSLIQQNAQVICLDNLSSGRLENISHLLDNDHFRFIEHDISIPVDLDEKLDFIFHLASRASPFEFEKFPLDILKSNTYGTLNSLELAKRSNAIMLFTSTSEVYGDAHIVPTPESYQGNVNPVGIRGCYDEAKRVGEAFCMAYVRQFNCDVRIARIFNTYGPRMRSDGYYGRVIPRFIQQANNGDPITIFGDGKQTRSFCYITDQVEGLFRLAGTDNLKGEIVNIGNPEEVTILQLAHNIIVETNSKSPTIFQELPPDDPKRRCPVIEKARDLLEWHPKISLKDGLRRTIYSFNDKHKH
ncbi:MAG: SDR family oxidoreductase [Methanomicrobiales archaeon]|nr:SDR family oxidoreductase [Methanomicrobiales archaeon]